MNNDFVDFNGEEDELDFLRKCVQQWDITISKRYSETQKLMHIATIISEMRHRIQDMEA